MEQWGVALSTFVVLVLIFYVSLLLATRGSKWRRVVVPLVMIPLILYVLWGFRWML